jgi:predicted DCC family thiol-disulfide oxidoreductase YuxK
MGHQILTQNPTQFPIPLLDSDALIVLIDAQCPFCLRWVRWILKQDKEKRIRFAPIHHYFSNPDSVILIQKGKCYSHGRAIIQLLKAMPFPWKQFGYLLSLAPAFVVNGLYLLVGKRRYRLSAFCSVMDYEAYKAHCLSEKEMAALRSVFQTGIQ